MVSEAERVYKEGVVDQEGSWKPSVEIQYIIELLEKIKDSVAKL